MKNKKNISLNNNALSKHLLSNALENLILKNNTKNSKGLLHKLLHDKTKNLKSTVKALLDEISLREKLHIDLLYKIDENIFDQKTSLTNLKNLRAPNYFLDKFLETRKMTTKIEGNIIELQKEKRKESLDCWRDMMFLKKYLMSALKEYWDFVKRSEFLDNEF
ncbi:MAG: hypothetical protein K9L30_15935 [Desulfobacterales bacterium]|nr:hypothetical protein [Desulfobacterales bacterium]